MRTAEDILNKVLTYTDDTYDAGLKAINEARIEVIKECAEIRATLKDGKFTAHKTLILSLIEQVK